MCYTKTCVYLPFTRTHITHVSSSVVVPSDCRDVLGTCAVYFDCIWEKYANLCYYELYFDPQLNKCREKDVVMRKYKKLCDM